MLVLSKTQKRRGAFVPQQLQCGDNMYGEVQKKKQNCRHITKELPFIMQIEEKEICFPSSPRDSKQRMVNSKLREPHPTYS